MDDPPEDAPVLPSGWVRIGRYRWYTGWAAVSSVVTTFLAIYAVQFAVGLGRLASYPVAIGVVVVVLGAIFGVITLVQNVRYPQPWVNFDSGEFRSGRHTVPIDRLDWAFLVANPAGFRKKEIIVLLRFGAKHGPRAVFILRDRQDRTIGPETSALLVELLRRSSIRMPESPYDPTGRFARYNFPGHLSREDAIAAVLSPPAYGDSLIEQR